MLHVPTILRSGGMLNSVQYSVPGGCLSITYIQCSRGALAVLAQESHRTHTLLKEYSVAYRVLKTATFCIAFRHSRAVWPSIGSGASVSLYTGTAVQATFAQSRTASI